MTEKIKSELISRRRAFSLLGLTAALGFAVPSTVLTMADAEAQTVGMERRQERRTPPATNGVKRDVEAAQRPLGLAGLLAQSNPNVAG